jgi:choline dehydrogenase-like flavoprotein
VNLRRMHTYPTTDCVDAVVIGTGAGGSPLLSRLAARGLRVVALEAGENHDPETYPADEAAASGIYWQGERLSAGDTPQAFGANNSGTGVGGSTLHWGAFCPRPDPRDFRLRSEQGVGCDWPFALDELLPYYSEVENFIGVSGPASYPWGTRDYRLPPLKRNASAQLMQAACDSLGLKATDAPAAVVSRPVTQSAVGDRPACINCGYCHQGCRIGAKSSMDVTYLPLAVAQGAEIRPGATACDFEYHDSGKISAVIYRQDGALLRQRCRNVFLCAGAVETPRLLLHTGIANSSGQVGRNYMAHVATQVWGSFDQETRPNKGYPSSLITEDLLRPQDADFAGGYLIQSLGVVFGTWAETVARSRRLWGKPLEAYLQQYNHVAGLGINGECLPQAGNFLQLADETDALGIPKAKISFSEGANERALGRHASWTMRQLWDRVGARDVWTGSRSAHTIGTCRMGHSATEAVVDATGCSYDIENLWICDNSIFPSALAANPALTIMALSLRTADRFLDRA